MARTKQTRRKTPRDFQNQYERPHTSSDEESEDSTFTPTSTQSTTSITAHAERKYAKELGHEKESSSSFPRLVPRVKVEFDSTTTSPMPVTATISEVVLPTPSSPPQPSRSELYPTGPVTCGECGQVCNNFGAMILHRKLSTRCENSMAWTERPASRPMAKRSPPSSPPHMEQ